MIFSFYFIFFLPSKYIEKFQSKTVIQNPSSNKKLAEMNSKTLSRYSIANNKFMLIRILVSNT